jgi:hypothetical protein
VGALELFKQHLHGLADDIYQDIETTCRHTASY